MSSRAWGEPATTTRWYAICSLFLAFSSGCADVLAPRPAPLFAVPLAIEGEPIGPGVIDTGGGYELMLRDDFGLTVVGTADVLAFGGVETVGVTEGFRYSAGGWEATAEAALVGVSVCECNGVGFQFFRKTGAVLALDFVTREAAFLSSIPDGGITIVFEQPPSSLPDFHSAFIEVEVAADGDSRVVRGLIDTGTNATVMRRGLVGSPSSLPPNRVNITVSHPQLGTVAVQAALFDTPGLPDIILGTDVMSAWSDRWYFSFTPGTGWVTVFPHAPSDADPLARVRDRIGAG